MNGNRHADPHMNSPSDDRKTEALAQASEYIETCLRRRGSLNTVLQNLRERKLQNEALQEDLNDVFDAETALVKLALIAHEGYLSEVLADIREAGMVDEDQLKAFETFWGRHDWIADGAEAYRLKAEHGTTFWTNAGLGCNRRGEEIYVQHEMDWGVDEVHKIEAPLPIIWSDWTSRLNAVLDRLQQSDIDSSEIDPKLVSALEESIEKIHKNVNAFDISGEGLSEQSDQQKSINATKDDHKDDEQSSSDESFVGFE